jgi:hypothetical protein
MRMITARLVVSACLALAAGATACGGDDEQQQEQQAAGPTTTAAAEPAFEELEIGGAPTAVADADGAVWVVRNQGDTVSRSIPGRGRWPASPSPSATGRSAWSPREAASGS